MKKHNEGYTLPLVLVVFLVLSLVVVSILTVAASNLHSQKVVIQRMKDQYAAQGAVEAVVAQLTNQTLMTGFQASALEPVPDKIDQICAGIYPVGSARTIYRDEEISGEPVVGEDKALTYSFDLVSRSGSVAVLCKIELKGTFEPSLQGDGTTLYTVSSPAVTFKSYRITTIDGNGGGG